MSKVTTEKLQNKHKIHIEYSTKIGLSFAHVVPERDGVIIRIFLKNKSFSVSSDEIDYFTIAIRPDKEKKKSEC